MAVIVPIISEFDSKGFDKAIKEFQSLEGVGAKSAFALKKAALPAAAMNEDHKRRIAAGACPEIEFLQGVAAIGIFASALCGGRTPLARRPKAARCLALAHPRLQPVPQRACLHNRPGEQRGHARDQKPIAHLSSRKEALGWTWCVHRNNARRGESLRGEFPLPEEKARHIGKLEHGECHRDRRPMG